MQDSLGHRCEIKSPIETVAECTQIAIGILVKSQIMECPAETGRQVDEQRINPTKFMHLIRMPYIHDHGLMSNPLRPQHGGKPHRR